MRLGGDPDSTHRVERSSTHSEFFKDNSPKRQKKNGGLRFLSAVSKNENQRKGVEKMKLTP